MAAVAYRLDGAGEKVALYLMIDEETAKVVKFADSSGTAATSSPRSFESSESPQPFDPKETYVTFFVGPNDGSELYWDTEVRGSEVKTTADLFTNIAGQFKTVDEHHCMIQARYAWKWNEADGGRFDIYRDQDYPLADVVREISTAPFEPEFCCIVMRVCHLFE